VRWSAFGSGNDDGESRGQGSSSATPGEVSKFIEVSGIAWIFPEIVWTY